MWSHSLILNVANVDKLMFDATINQTELTKFQQSIRTAHTVGILNERIKRMQKRQSIDFKKEIFGYSIESSNNNKKTRKDFQTKQIRLLLSI